MKLSKHLVAPLVAILFISMFMACARAPTPALPTLEAVPNVIAVPGAGETVSIDIWVKNVVEDWDIIGFQFKVPFETEWLAPAFRTKGDFMEAFVNDGELGILYQVVSDIPYKPNWNIMEAMVLALPDSYGQYYPPFPSGEGRLITLNYKGTGQGVGQSMPIDIVDTTILNKDLLVVGQPANINLVPNTLNLKSRGKWITAYIELPEGDVNNIDISSIKLNGTISVDPEAPYLIGDYNENGVPDLMVLFSRAAVSQFILSEGIKFGSVTLTLTGQDTQGNAILGIDTLRVKMPGDNNFDGKVDGCDIGIVARGYGSNPGNPRWNSCADENEDGIIDMKDVMVTVRLFGTSY